MLGTRHNKLQSKQRNIEVYPCGLRKLTWFKIEIVLLRERENTCAGIPTGQISNLRI